MSECFVALKASLNPDFMCTHTLFPFKKNAILGFHLLNIEKGTCCFAPVNKKMIMNC